MFVELTLPDGTLEDVNTDTIRSMKELNTAPDGDTQPSFVTAITFVSGKTERYKGSRKEIQAAFKLAWLR
jgi:hypothetical protein